MAFDFHAATGQAAEVFHAEQVVVAEGVDFAVFDGIVAGINGNGRPISYALLHAVAGEGAAEYVVGHDAFAIEGGFAERQAEAVVVRDFKRAVAAGEGAFFEVWSKGVIFLGQRVVAAPQYRAVDVGYLVSFWRLVPHLSNPRI